MLRRMRVVRRGVELFSAFKSRRAHGCGPNAEEGAESQERLPTIGRLPGQVKRMMTSCRGPQSPFFHLPKRLDQLKGPIHQYSSALRVDSGALRNGTVRTPFHRTLEGSRYIRDWPVQRRMSGPPCFAPSSACHNLKSFRTDWWLRGIYRLLRERRETEYEWSAMTTERRYVIVDFDEVPPVDCPCGEARRALLEAEQFPGTIHRTVIRGTARTHYHERLTETYYILECQPDARLELDRALLIAVSSRAQFRRRTAGSSGDPRPRET